MSEIVRETGRETARETGAPGLFDRALRRLANVWRDMAAGVGGEDESVADVMRDCLEARGGEVSARARAARLAETYLRLDQAGRLDFLRVLAGFDSDVDAVARAYEDVQSAPDAATRARAKAGLRRALEPPRVRLLAQFTTIPDGMKFLVDLRATLLDGMEGDPLLTALEGDLKGLLMSWFDVGMLELVRIDWSSPASLLEKLVAYEAVHSIRSWSDLKNRLDSDRRCYALFHPRMPGEPLIFVEVALTQGLAASVQKLLDKRAPVLDAKQADTAIFYSISNCQRGLAGISLGNFLIKRVVELLAREFKLKQFSTLSPIPGFRRWLDKQVAAATAGEGAALLSDEESAALRTAAPAEAPACETGAQALAAVLRHRGWQRDPAMLRAAEPVLMRLCARYLLVESRGKRALDPVAHFHLSNGARVERLNMLGDVSEKGVKESATLMVNYLYDPANIEDYHEAYAGEGKRTASTAVRRLARGWV
jgi:malonyl-CoA decarboxylase